MAGTANENGIQVVRMITHQKKDQFLKLSENHRGEFTVIAQNGPLAASYIFDERTPAYMQEALRNLQVAMERSNREGTGGGTNSQMQADL